ncbi:hypothetical protein BJX99DRAFT_18440 [Aspergillus californicus]
MDNYAHQACIRCRKQKRKCSRLLPVCARCKRLNLTRLYHGTVEDYTPPASPLESSLPVPDVSSHTLQSHVYSIIGGDSSVAQSAAAYFGTIHSWFPIINRDVFYRNLRRHTEPPAELSLLTMCMYLLGILPADSRINRLYIFLSGLVVSFAAAGVNTLGLLESRLLLSLFEVGHGMYSAAYISMGANIRAVTLYKKSHPVEEAEDAERVWKGLSILDRYISLEMGQASSSLKEIPSQDKSAAQQPFANLYRASTLLEPVLAHIFNEAPFEQKSAEAIPLLERLAALRNSIGEKDQKHLAYPATAVCSSTFMTLLEFGYGLEYPLGKDCRPLSFALLEVEVQQFIRIAEGFSKTLSTDNVANMSFFLIHSIGKSAIIILRHFRESPTIDVPSSLECLVGLLEKLKKRWSAAGDYLDKIRREQE